MSLVLITQHYYPNKGGMAQSCDRIVRSFRKHGVPVHVVHFTNRKRKFHTEAAIQGSYTAVPVYSSEEYTLNLAAQCIQQLAAVKEVNYVVAFGGHLPIVLSPIISKWIEKPLITLIRGNDFDEAIFSKRREGLLYALRNSEFVFTVTDEKKEKIIQLLAHPKTYFTPNGINCKLWEPSKSQQTQIESFKKRSGAKKRIVIVGQLKVKKGILEFSNAFSDFQYKEEYEIWMVGDVAQTTKDQIEAIDIQVQFFPFVNTNELLTFYHAADIVLIPSFYDGMPNVLLESGASKKLVIGSKVGGIQDVIEHGKDGFLFNPLQPSSLLETLYKVHKLDPKQQAEIANRLFTKISTLYTEEKEIINYLTALQL